MNERIKLEDTPMEMMIKLSEGNPGALSVLMRMLSEGADIDPQCAFGGLGGMIGLDTHGIYGARIWMLYKDACGEDLVKTLAVLRACQLGKLSDIEMQHAIDFGGAGIDVDELVKIVKGELAEFDAAA